MKFKSILLGSVMTLALVCALVFACVAGVVAAPYVQRQMGAFRVSTSAPVSSIESRPIAPAAGCAGAQCHAAADGHTCAGSGGCQ